DRRDLGFADALDGGDTGAGGNTVDMHGARTAERHATAEFRAGHAEHVAQHPEERRVAVDIDAVCVPVDRDGEGHDYCSGASACQARNFTSHVEVRPSIFMAFSSGSRTV